MGRLCLSILFISVAYVISLSSVCFALTGADLPGEGEELVIETDQTIRIRAGETADLGGTLLVRQGAGGNRPRVTIYNNGSLNLGNGSIKTESADLLLVNEDSGTMGSSLGEIWTLWSDHGDLTIKNYGTMNLGLVDLNADNDGTIRVSSASTAIATGQISGDVSGESHIEVNITGGTFEALNMAFNVVGGSLSIENRGQFDLNNLSVTDTGHAEVFLRNSGDMFVNNLNSFASVAWFRLENAGQLTMNNTNLTSQMDDSIQTGEESVLVNSGNVSMNSVNLVANGGSGRVKILNAGYLYWANVFADGNYGGTIRICNSGGEMVTGNLNSDSSGYSHGYPSRFALIVDDGVVTVTNTNLNVNSGNAAVMNLAELYMNNLTLHNISGDFTLVNLDEIDINNTTSIMEDGGFTMLGCQAGNVGIHNFQNTFAGDEDGLSALSFWNGDTFDLDYFTILGCFEDIDYPIDAGLVTTFYADCSTDQGYPADLPSSPWPATGSVDVEPSSVTLSWEGDFREDVTYDLYLMEEEDEACLLCTYPQASRITETVCTVTDLDPCTTYLWQIVAYSGDDVPTLGPVWSFTTRCEGTASEEDSTEIHETEKRHCIMSTSEFL
ncbi:MAG TPA: fibronectin type III domain-containing protein [Deltaproteobacteria bacterium]|nr:fibronectin type III domain-containing protein [Deltaproteobacteria bacterium]HPR55255.1 fibronectin type III domain-containing protein [Deltaproteobacteria bacterium]HXK46892.1 fibronectin type III domain-containing protein [Deltaproteobacteria bacterium]